MKGKYLRKFGGLALAALVLSGIVLATPSTTDAQGRRIVRRPYPYRLYRRYDVFGYDRWGYDRFGFDRFGRDRWGNERFGANPWSPYGSRYRQYVFSDSEKAVNQGYKDGFKTGKDDGKKAKSYKPERSHYYHDAGFGNYAEVYRSAFSRGYKDGYSVGMDDRAGK